MIKQFFFSIAVAGGISGCVSQFHDYDGTAKRVALANLCYKENYLDFQQFSHYATFQFGTYAHQYIVDDELLRAMYEEEVARLSQQDLTPYQEQFMLECGKIATVAERVRPKGNVNIQGASGGVSNTFCNTVGTTTFCQTR